LAVINKPIVKNDNNIKRANIVYVCGGSDTGKTSWVKRQLSGYARYMVWDCNDEYSGVRITDIRTLIDIARGSKTEPFRLRFVSPDVTSEVFSQFCEVAFLIGNCAVVAEELADVTRPGKAPKGWGLCLRRGRHQRLSVYGITTRPAESDKTILGNATLIHVCKLRRLDDRRYIAKELDIPLEVINAIRPFEFVEREGNKPYIRGKITM
jgi:hypothetical protein